MFQEISQLFCDASISTISRQVDETRVRVLCHTSSTPSTTNHEENHILPVLYPHHGDRICDLFLRIICITAVTEVINAYFNIYTKYLASWTRLAKVQCLEHKSSWYSPINRHSMVSASSHTQAVKRRKWTWRTTWWMRRARMNLSNLLFHYQRPAQLLKLSK